MLCRVELLSYFFLFHLSYFCLFCLLLLPYYVVNKVEYISSKKENQLKLQQYIALTHHTVHAQPSSPWLPNIKDFNPVNYNNSATGVDLSMWDVDE